MNIEPSGGACPYINTVLRYVMNGNPCVEEIEKSIKYLQNVRDDENAQERARVRAAEALARIASDLAAKSVAMLALAETKAKRESEASAGTGRVTVNIRPISEKPATPPPEKPDA